MSTNTVKGISVKQSLSMARQRGGKLAVFKHNGLNYVQFVPEGPGHKTILTFDKMALTELIKQARAIVEEDLEPASGLTLPDGFAVPGGNELPEVA